MDDLTGNLFSLFYLTLARGVENICEIFSDFENVSQKLFTKKKNGETRIKRALDYLRIPKLQEIFTIVAKCVIATGDSLFCKMFSPLFCMEQKTLKNSSKRRNTSKIKEKRSRDEK